MKQIWNEHDVIDAALCELHRTRQLYPLWPADLVHAAAVVTEEAGEVLKAANDVQWHNKSSREELTRETIQMIAMGIRLLCDTPGLVGIEIAITPKVKDTSGDIEALAMQLVHERSVLRSEVARLTSVLQREGSEQ